MLAGLWWHTALNSPLRRQRQIDLWVQDQPSLQIEFQDSQDSTEKPRLENQKQTKK